MLLNPEFVIGAPGSRDRSRQPGRRTRDELRRAGEQLAIGILERASSESIARTKRILLQILGLPLDEALQRAAIANAEARATADCKHGIATFLATKAPPTWRESGD